MTIKDVRGREVLDSRGNPTVEVECKLSDDNWGRAIVPSGASTGEHEVLELRDKDPKRYLGKGVLTAIKNIKDTIAPAIIGKSFDSLAQLDQTLLDLDGTEQKSKLGANAILGVSLAAAHAKGQSENKPLYQIIQEAAGLTQKDLKMPIPLMNIINGGEHANNPLEIQEFMIVPHGFNKFSESLRAGAEIFHHLKKKLNDMGESTAVGDEGGFAPNLESNTKALEVICEAIEAAGYKLGKEVSLALDVASSSFYDKGNYKIKLQGKDQVSKDELINYYTDLLEKFPIVSIEDALDENDWDGWKSLTEKIGSKVQLVGDDLFVTNPKFVKKGIENKVANAVLIKFNQIGTLTETLETINLCRSNNYAQVASHRSGETEDVTVAHLAMITGQIKTGSLSRGERTAKYNELLRIEEASRAPLAQPF